jgi:hypothetical protein
MMTKRLLPLTLFAAATMLMACENGTTSTQPGTRAAYADDWRMEVSGPAAGVTRLVVGGRTTKDNFANRGDIEVRYVAGTDQITVEMQRFTIANKAEDAEAAFGRMHMWAYNIASPAAPKDSDAERACFSEGQATCFIRNYYEGQLQPARDGVNFRVTIPAGWPGKLELVTEDNLQEGIETYPSRGDVLVDGLSGSLAVSLDSGNVQVRMDPNTAHYAGCASNDACISMDHAPGCGCTEPTNVTIANRPGQASDITVDVANPNAWYTMVLENRGSFSAGSDFICDATIQCSAFEDCAIDPDYASLAYQERAEVNYPGEPAIEGAGMRIALTSESCADIVYAEGPDDYDADSFPDDHRGDIMVCVGCLQNL